MTTPAPEPVPTERFTFALDVEEAYYQEALDVFSYGKVDATATDDEKLAVAKEELGNVLTQAMLQAFQTRKQMIAISVASPTAFDVTVL